MRIAIAGFGAEGQSSYRYYTAKGHDVTIVTDKVSDHYPIPVGAKAIVSGDAFDQLDDFDLVLRTPPMSPRSIRTNGKIWSQTNEFFATCPAPIIGVTGSKGKGTTCSLVAEILRAHVGASGRQVHLVGNIGVPALDILDSIQAEDVVVFELSSFQLWDLERSPTVAVMTLLEPDHLDVHADMAEYVTAKSQIFAHQTPRDFAVYNEQDERVRQLAEDAMSITHATGLPFLNKKCVHIEQSTFYYADQEIGSTDMVTLPGEHNLRNAAAAIAATWHMTNGDIKAIRRGLSSFTGLPHRLKLVGTVNNIAFYDDSIATTPGSAIAAIRSFDSPTILILGGHDKGADYTELGRVINESTVKMVYVIGANCDKIESQVSSVSDVTIKKLETKIMAEIVHEVYQAATPGDVVILSPAAASFDMFTSYKDRGDQFIAAVKGLC